MRLRHLVLAVALLGGCRIEGEPWRATPPTTDERFFVMLPTLRAAVQPTGVTVMTARSSGGGLVHVSVVLRAGYEHDPPGKEGLARLAARVLQLASTAPEVDARYGRLGAQPSAWVSRAGLVASVDVLPWDVGEAATLLADLVGHVRGSVADFDVAKAEALANLDRMRGQPEALAAVAVARIFAPRRGTANLGFGSPASVSAITRDDVERYLNSACNTRGAALVVTGNVETDGTQDLGAAAFTKWPEASAWAPVKPTPESRRASNLVFVPVAGMEQTLIVVAGSRPPPAAPGAPAFDAALDILTARMQQALREVLRVSYGVLPLTGEDDTFVVGIRVRADATRVALREIEAALRESLGAVPPMWLHARRLTLSGEMMLDAQDAGGVARHAIEVFLSARRADAMQRSLAALQELETPAVESSAEDHLVAARVQFVVVGDPDRVGDQLGRGVVRWSPDEVLSLPD